MEITLPTSLKSDESGYNFFSFFYHNTKHLENNYLIINFRICYWFEANLCAVFGAVIQNLINNKNKIEFVNMSNEIKGVLSRNQFLAHFKNIQVERNFKSSTICFNSFTLEQENEIKSYVELELLEKEEMPKISALAKKEIITSIFEIFVNAITHGECANIYTCGQFFKRKNPAFVYFTFVDLGKTIKANVNQYNQTNWNGAETINWATSENNTTKRGNHSGGLGLKLIQDFIKINNGKMHIISSNGFWDLTRNDLKTTIMEYDFPGTIVTLAINLDKAVAYKLTIEDNQNILF